jgi:hypothetical protein
MPATPKLPQRAVDETDSDRSLLLISDRSPSFRIERIVTLLFRATKRKRFL